MLPWKRGCRLWAHKGGDVVYTRIGGEGPLILHAAGKYLCLKSNLDLGKENIYLGRNEYIVPSDYSWSIVPVMSRLASPHLGLFTYMPSLNH